MNIESAKPRSVKAIPPGEQSTLYFTPSPEAEVALLGRMLYREGYNNHNWGHITYIQPDGTILINPWEVPWDELRASDVLRVDHQGNLLSGRWTVTPAIRLHLAAHRLRPEVKVALHHHPEWGTVWAAADEMPPVFHQNGASVPRLALYEEFDGAVVHEDLAEANVRAMGDADAAILANHGVFVVGKSIASAHWLAVTLELRCKMAWRVRAMGAEGLEMKPAAVETLVQSIQTGASGPRFHHAMIRREILADASVLT